MVRVLLAYCPTYQRLVCLAIGFLLVTGCGDKQVDKPLPRPKSRLAVQLPWSGGAQIPRQYTCDGANQAPVVRTPGASPPLIAIVMSDPDAPGGTFIHWTRWGRGIEGENSFGKVGYRGPCPPEGDKPHRYVVTVYGLERPLPLKRGASVDEVLSQVQKLAIASGSQTGTYGR
jgi:phosphatidylethanolamine-binding protein (PEBP) family uncharacterized protein